MKQTLLRFIQNIYFLLFTFATGLFYFCFYLVGIALGLSLSFTLIGIPLLTFVLRTTSTFVQYERVQTKIYSDITTLPYRSKTIVDASFWKQAREELLDHRNWQVIFWLMLKFVIGSVALIFAVVLSVTPLVFILAPILFYVCDIYFFGGLIDTLKESLLLTTIGTLITIPCYWLSNYLVRIMGIYTRLIIKNLSK
ncbi:sensor domain-containing protein [Paenibacillus sp. L3-i20]|uniref:sensor domain-containing protein n=1 Tax=Paenibacillus sp. L3-i20 TaxID=2905833 RepID=UPI001EDE1617|nr:sensor domain-containing protein [Paenibacillus sp. L3-i20]